MLQRSNILVLKGVYLRDFEVVENIPEPIVEPPMNYDEIPVKFYSIEKWPKSTNLLCWICDEIPSSYPKFLPKNPEKNQEYGDICDVEGNFCSWNCATTYMEQNYPKEQHWDYYELITLFASKWTGKKYRYIAADPKTRMRQYCGKSGITRKEWVAQFKTVDCLPGSFYDII